MKIIQFLVLVMSCGFANIFFAMEQGIDLESMSKQKSGELIMEDATGYRSDGAESVNSKGYQIASYEELHDQLDQRISILEGQLVSIAEMNPSLVSSLEEQSKLITAIQKSLESSKKDGSLVNVQFAIDSVLVEAMGAKRRALEAEESLQSLEKSLKIFKVVGGVFMVCSTLFHLGGEQLKWFIYTSLRKEKRSMDCGEDEKDLDADLEKQ